MKWLVWLTAELTAPPPSLEAGATLGAYLKQLRAGEKLAMPSSRPMPVIGPACHQLRSRDWESDWRVFYHIAHDAIVVLEAVRRTTRTTPRRVIRTCRRRLRAFMQAGLRRTP